MDGGKLLRNTVAIKGGDILLMLQPTQITGCISTTNVFVGKSNPANYFNVCYFNKLPPEPIPMKHNYWAYMNGANEVADLNPTSNMTIRKNSCQNSVAVDAGDIIPASRINCEAIHDCWFELLAPGGGYSEACTVAATSSTVIEQQFAEAYSEFLQEEFEQADALFQPLSNLYENEATASYTTWCKQYVHVARAIVEPESSGLRRAKPAAAKLLISPNPASSNVVISSPGGAFNRLKISDLQGKIRFETNCPGSCEISLENWPPGLYFIKADWPTGQSAVQKLVVIQ